MAKMELQEFGLERTNAHNSLFVKSFAENPERLKAGSRSEDCYFADSLRLPAERQPSRFLHLHCFVNHRQT